MQEHSTPLSLWVFFVMMSLPSSANKGIQQRSIPTSCPPPSPSPTSGSSLQGRTNRLLPRGRIGRQEGISSLVEEDVPREDVISVMSDSSASGRRVVSRMNTSGKFSLESTAECAYSINKDHLFTAMSYLRVTIYSAYQSSFFVAFASCPYPQLSP